MDHDRAPYFEALKSYLEQQNLTFHVPGHQHGTAVPPEFLGLIQAHGLACDITEVYGLDDIHAPWAQCGEAQRLAADLYGADQTFFLVNGSTVGNQTMFLSAVRPDETVLLPHNSHRSVYSALILSGCQAHFFATDIHPELLCSLPPTLEQAVRAMDAFPGAAALFLTSPNYHGACSPVEEIVLEAHRRGLKVLVDEAWGSHITGRPDLKSAVQAGADMVVQSSHKLSSAMTQGALLHVNGDRVAASRVQTVLSHLQTSSPSSLIVASLDCARRQDAKHGERLWKRALEIARHLQCEIDRLEGVNCFPVPENWDQNRLIIDAGDRGYTGYELERSLRSEYWIQVEMSEPHQVTLLVTPGHTTEHADRLIAALSSLPDKEETSLPRKEIRRLIKAVWGRVRLFETPQMPVRTAFLGRQSPVILEKAVDQTCAELLYCYPPGVPFVYPGQRLGKEAIELIGTWKRLGFPLRGAADPSLETVLILENEL